MGLNFVVVAILAGLVAKSSASSFFSNIRLSSLFYDGTAAPLIQQNAEESQHDFAQRQLTVSDTWHELSYWEQMSVMDDLREGKRLLAKKSDFTLEQRFGPNCKSVCGEQEPLFRISGCGFFETEDKDVVCDYLPESQNASDANNFNMADQITQVCCGYVFTDCCIYNPLRVLLAILSLAVIVICVVFCCCSIWWFCPLYPFLCFAPKKHKIHEADPMKRAVRKMRKRAGLKTKEQSKNKDPLKKKKSTRTVEKKVPKNDGKLHRQESLFDTIEEVVAVDDVELEEEEPETYFDPEEGIVYTHELGDILQVKTGGGYTDKLYESSNRHGGEH